MAKHKGNCEQAQIEWRPLYGYETTARIAKDGAVQTLDRVVIDRNGKEQRISGQLITARINGGSLVIFLKRQQIVVGRAVAESWIRPITSEERVVYLDGNPTNASLDNVKIVNRSEAMQFKRNKTRASQNRKRRIQRKGEVWRQIPNFILYSISNLSRVKSRALMPETLLKVCKSGRSTDVIYLHKDGRTFARSIASLMREVWPELASEYLTAHQRRSESVAKRRQAAIRDEAKGRRKAAEKQGSKRPKNRGKMASKSG